jgi:chromate transporter
MTRLENRPQSKTDLFMSFSLLALQGFGGVLAIVQREIVEKKQWLTQEEFLEDWAVAQILPGPNVVNLSLMIGDRYFGFAGALAALAGMLAFPLVIVLALAALLGGFTDSAAAQGALRGMGAVAAGLITATGIKLVGALKNNVMGLAMCCVFAFLSFVAIALLRLPLVWVLLGVGGLACLRAYVLLAHSQRTEGSR